jgi:integrase
MLCMKGNIYTDQKCPECGGTLVHDERRGGLFCSTHPEIAAAGGFRVRFGRQIRRRFQHYSDAARFLTGLRFKSDEGTLDARDYAADNPLAFDTLAEAFLQEKRHLKSFEDIRRMVERAQEFFGSTNVKAIRTPDLKRFARSLTCGDKTRANYMTVLHNFFAWYLVEEEVLQSHQVPKFPEIEFELGWRKVITWEQQDAILDQIRKDTWEVNPKLWLAADLLRTYTSLRPGDLWKLTEGDIDTEAGLITILHPTKSKNRSKTVWLLPEHVETIKTIKAQFPALPATRFFRHHTGNHGTAAGTPWSRSYLSRVWNAACDKLGIEGVDLYGGTRHTTTTELAKAQGTEAARDATGHRTNKAFDRYCQIQGQRAFAMAKFVQARKKCPAG